MNVSSPVIKCEQRSRRECGSARGQAPLYIRARLLANLKSPRRRGAARRVHQCWWWGPTRKLVLLGRNFVIQGYFWVYEHHHCSRIVIPSCAYSPDSLTDCCLSSACFSFPSISHNAPAAAFFTSLLVDVRSFRNSAEARASFLIPFLFSSSKANVHKVLQAFTLSSSSLAFSSILTRIGMAPDLTI